MLYPSLGQRLAPELGTCGQSASQMQASPAQVMHTPGGASPYMQTCGLA